VALRAGFSSEQIGQLIVDTGTGRGRGDTGDLEVEVRVEVDPGARSSTPAAVVVVIGVVLLLFALLAWVEGKDVTVEVGTQSVISGSRDAESVFRVCLGVVGLLLLCSSSCLKVLPEWGK
jgi:hypothetical protein